MNDKIILTTYDALVQLKPDNTMHTHTTRSEIKIVDWRLSKDIEN